MTTTPSSETASSSSSSFLSTLGLVVVASCRWTWGLLREAVWVARTLPRLVFVLAALAVGAAWLGYWLESAPPLALLVGLLTYPKTSPSRWGRVTDRALAYDVRTGWEDTCISAGLSVADPHHRHRPGDAEVPGPLGILTPSLLSCRASRGVVTVRARLHSGMTYRLVDDVVPALAVQLGAHAVQVRPQPPNLVALDVTFRDVLSTPTAITPDTITARDTITAAVTPDAAATASKTSKTSKTKASKTKASRSKASKAVGSDGLVMPYSGGLPQVEVGRMPTGEPWTLSPCVHTFVAGATGAGKASVMWSLLVGLAPFVASGHVRLVGIDLKAGMELAWARNLFAALATTPDQAVALLESLAEEMTVKADRMAGVSRKHTPTPEDPATIVVIDELGALTAFAPSPALRMRADKGLGLLLALGRAPGYAVWAFAQDPRKETCTHRHLFPRGIGLRLDSPSEVAMVLGDHVIDAAPADRIPITDPGTAYLVEDTGLIVKVRAHHVPDATLSTLNARYTTRHHLDIPDTPTGDTPGRAGRADFDALFRDLDTLLTTGEDTDPPTPSASSPSPPSSSPSVPPPPPSPSSSGRARTPRKPRRPRTTTTSEGNLS